jgi:hypothetical protein
MKNVAALRFNSRVFIPILGGKELSGLLIILSGFAKMWHKYFRELII